MGITGLLPFVKKSTREVNLRTFSGSTVAIDVYSWMHKGAFACASELGQGIETQVYVRYCMSRLEDIIQWGLKPIVVFDGRHLSSKVETEKKRRENRKLYKQRAKTFLAQGKQTQAREAFQRCVDVTPEMAHQVLEACLQRKGLVDCIVAPFEADAQLAFLSRNKYADIIITEDSDLILFGCSKILFKLDRTGNGSLFELENLSSSLGNAARNFTLDTFRHMCILSGCDYLANLPKVGLAKAYKFFSVTQQTDLRKSLKKLPYTLRMSTLVVSDDYIENFIRADRTFLYQLVFDPQNRTIVPLTEYRNDIFDDNLDYAGERLPLKTALQLSLGNIRHDTLKPWQDGVTGSNPRCGCFTDMPEHCIWSPSYQPGLKIPAAIPSTSMISSKRSLPASLAQVFAPAPAKKKRFSMPTGLPENNTEETDESEMTLVKMYAERKSMNLQRISSFDESLGKEKLQTSKSLQSISSYFESQQCTTTRRYSGDNKPLSPIQQLQLSPEKPLDVLAGYNPFAKTSENNSPRKLTGQSVNNSLKQHGALLRLAEAKIEENKQELEDSKSVSPYFQSEQPADVDMQVKTFEKVPMKTERKEKPSLKNQFGFEARSSKNLVSSRQQKAKSLPKTGQTTLQDAFAFAVVKTKSAIESKERKESVSKLTDSFSFMRKHEVEERVELVKSDGIFDNETSGASGLQDTCFQDAFAAAMKTEKQGRHSKSPEKTTTTSACIQEAFVLAVSETKKGVEGKNRRQSSLQDAFDFAVTDAGTEKVLNPSALVRQRSRKKESLRDLFGFKRKATL